MMCLAVLFTQTHFFRARCVRSVPNIEFVSQLNKYIPSLVLQNLLSENKIDTTAKEVVHVKKQLPTLQPMETVVCFADISGFTNAAE